MSIYDRIYSILRESTPIGKEASKHYGGEIARHIAFGRASPGSSLHSAEPDIKAHARREGRKLIRSVGEHPDQQNVRKKAKRKAWRNPASGRQSDEEEHKERLRSYHSTKWKKGVTKKTFNLPDKDNDPNDTKSGAKTKGF